MIKSLHLIIKGRVQGVFFRDTTKKKADSLGLKGYVRNLHNGNVEVMAQGPEDKLLELIEYCKQGPEYSEVSDVIVKWTSSIENFSIFDVKY